MAGQDCNYLGIARLRDDACAYADPVLCCALPLRSGRSGFFSRSPLLPEPGVSDGVSCPGECRHRDREPIVRSIRRAPGRRSPGIEWGWASLRLAMAFPDRRSAADVTRNYFTG